MPSPVTAQVVGSKRVVLWPPDEEPNLYCLASRLPRLWTQRVLSRVVVSLFTAWAKNT